MSDLASAIVAGLDDDALDALAERLAPRLESRWRDIAPVLNRWMAPAAAGEHRGEMQQRQPDGQGKRKARVYVIPWPTWGVRGVAA